MRAFQIGLLSELLPSLCHFFQNLAVPAGLGLAGQAAAFLGKSPVFRCGFHNGITAPQPRRSDRIACYACGTRSTERAGSDRVKIRRKTNCLHTPERAARNEVKRRTRAATGASSWAELRGSRVLRGADIIRADKNPAEWPGRGSWPTTTSRQQRWLGCRLSIRSGALKFRPRQAALHEDFLSGANTLSAFCRTIA